ncbi:hypothetical protein CGJ04_09075 [Vibrio parahaemolyticus]|uniref:right-handed parallel beta-helix repeat-containing protein n=1 Tax=Vibrio parahaemolyticus TaxID=670 RepID=UPI001124CA9F|nr:right-handed parallel beta-helix repeat-containing protein [Vibrio parahaemolyticus]TOG30831.1 hypothetical protein CGJ04_09075 [Vibrio parahaemolyticus]
MTQNIEQRTLAATATMEGAAKTVDEIANTDKDVSTPVGSRKSFPKISREWDEKSTALKTEWENDSATLRQDWQNERKELSTKALGVKLWESGVSETNINQQRRWEDGHTYLPKTVPVVMDASGPNDDWVPYTADKAGTLGDVFGRKPIDLVADFVLIPDAKQKYPKMNALGKVWELPDGEQQLTVKSFTETSDEHLLITLSDDSQIIADKVIGASLSSVEARLNKEVIDNDDPDVVPLPIRARFRRYDVREYGAVPGQDIAEILRKINARIKDGDTIYIPETYFCSETIRFDKSIQARKRFSIIGGGQILLPQNMYFRQVLFDPGDEEFERVIWEDVDLLCPYVDFPWSHEVNGVTIGDKVRGISAYRVNEFELLDTHFENQSFVAAEFRGCNDVETSENRLKNIGGNGFSTDKDNYGNVTRGFSAVRNRMKGVYDSFYGTHHCNDVLISLNKLYKNGSKAWINGQTGYGIDLAGTSDARVSENQIYGSVNESNAFTALAIHVHNYLGSVAKHVRLSGNEIFGTNGVKVDEGATDVRSMAEYIKGALNGYLIADATDVRMAETEIIDCVRKGVSDGDYGVIKDGRDFRDLTITGCDWGVTLKDEHRNTKLRSSKIYGNKTGDLYLPPNLDKSVTIYDIETSNSTRSDASVVPVGPFDRNYGSFAAETWTTVTKFKDSKFTYQVSIVSTGSDHYQGVFFVAGAIGATINIQEVVNGGFGALASLRVVDDELQVKFTKPIGNTRIRINEFFRD